MPKTIFLLLTLFLALTACAQTTAPTFVHPPHSTELPAPTETHVTPRKLTPTIEPFPTSKPLELSSGEPLTATVRRDGITLQVVVPKDTLFASEISTAQVTLRNDGTAPIVFEGSGRFLFFATVKDANGQPVVIDPLRGEFAGSWGPLFIKRIEPGQELTRTVQFQAPLDTQSKYTLWVSTQFQHPASDNPQLGDGKAIAIQTGPIPLHLQDPDAAHQLRLQLKADATGVDVQVTDGLGNPLTVPIHGIYQIGSNGGSETGGIDFDAQGHAERPWDKHFSELGSRVQLWVWADNHSVTTASVRRPGQVTSQPGLIAPPPTPR